MVYSFDSDELCKRLLERPLCFDIYLHLQFHHHHYVFIGTNSQKSSASLQSWLLSVYKNNTKLNIENLKPLDDYKLIFSQLF